MTNIRLVNVLGLSVIAITRFVIGLVVTSALAASLFAQSAGVEASRAGARQSPEAAAAMLQNAEKTGAKVDAIIEMANPLSADDLETVVLPGQIRSIFITSTTTNW